MKIVQIINQKCTFPDIEFDQVVASNKHSPVQLRKKSTIKSAPAGQGQTAIQKHSIARYFVFFRHYALFETSL